ncbi:hypothetical protein [Leptobacterium sp. I13]|uniref:hypothetical protein n=1 Tax=Leptobacterium meishanense TaxID=3128904 RepID=UPI0030ED32CD
MSFIDFKKVLKNKFSEHKNPRCSIYSSSNVVYKSPILEEDIDSIYEPKKDVSLFVKIYNDVSEIEYKYLNGEFEILSND